MKKSLVDLLDEATLKHADKTAIQTEAFSYNYLEFQSATINFAKRLQASGCSAEGLIGIYLDRSFEMVVGIFGILRNGSGYVPADPGNPPKRTSTLFGKLNIKYVVTSQQLKTLVEEMGFVAIVPTIDLARPRQGIDRTIPPEGIAYILFTSGSTGEPKGVEVTHKSVVNLVTYIQERYPLLLGEKVLLKSPYTFDGSVWELFGWILMGGTLFICNPGDEKNPKNLARIISKEQINFLFFVPSMLSVFVDYIDTLNDASCLASLKWVSVGGEVLTPTLVKHFYTASKNPQVRLINVYGPTETTVYATTYLCDPAKEYAKLPIGEAVTGDYIYILNDGLKQVAQGEEGEICIGGVGVANGYFNSAQYTNEKFVADPIKGTGRIYRTGDIGRQQPDGLYDFIGRKDFQVKLRGQRIELGEVENALQQIPEILECVVLFAPDRNKDDSLIAYIRPGIAGQTPLPEFRIADTAYANYLLGKLMESIPRYMLPSEIILCNRFPLNQNGKIDRLALPLISSFTDTAPIEAFTPGNRDEQTIYSIWMKILSRDSIAAGEDFFEAGGHSLKAIQVITEIIRCFNIEIPLSLFYKRLTLPLLCAYVSDHAISANALFDHLTITKTEGNTFGLTPVQTEMWVMNSYDPSGLTHNIQIEFTIEGDIEIELFLRALSETIQAEESFRSIFPFEGDGPVQSVLGSVEFNIPWSDLSSLANKPKDEEYAKIVYDNGHILFDFSKLPLFSLHLVKWGNGSFRILLAIHHIIFDGWSLSLLMQRVLARYHGDEPSKSAYRNGDYSHWLKEHYNENGYKKELGFWETTLQHIPHRLSLPTKAGADFAKAGLLGKRHCWPLPQELSSRIDAFAITRHTTPFVVIMSAFQIALAKHANQRKIVVGTPFANRQHPMTGELIGYFTNMVSIPSHLSEADTYDDFIARCNETAIGSFSNAMLPFGELVKKLGLKFEPGAYPIFQAIFVLQNWPHQPSENNGFRFTQREIGNETCKMDLLLNAEKCNEAYECWLEYDITLFTPQYIDALATDIQHTLEQIVTSPDRKILEQSHTCTQPGIDRLPDTCILIGEGSLACYCAELLFQQGFSIQKIVSDDARLLGFAKKNSIEAESSLSAKTAFGPADYLFSINNGYILPPEILGKAQKLAINYHDSPLPRYAGMYATNQAILSGETNHGITWHIITSEIDGGDILTSAAVDLLETDTAYSLNMRCYEAAITSFEDLINNLKKGDIQLKPQDKNSRHVFALTKRPAGFGIMDWQKPVNEIGTLLRACDFGDHSDNEFLLPCIWANNTLYNILKANILAKKHCRPGLVYAIGSSIGIGCTDGLLLVEKISDQSGQDVSPGDILIPGQNLYPPPPELAGQIYGRFKKLARHEPFWVKQFQQSDYFELPALPGEPHAVTDWDSIENIDHQWINKFEEGSPETLMAVVAYYFLRVARKNRGTFAYYNNPEEDEMPFGKWKPLNIVIDGNETLGNTILKIRSSIAGLHSHGNYCTNIVDRYPALHPLKGKVPFICIASEVTNTDLFKKGSSIVQVGERSIRLKGITPAIARALRSFLEIAGQHLDVPINKTPLMAVAPEKNIRVLQNVEACSPRSIEDVVTEFTSVSAKFPCREAIFDSGRLYTYGQLNQEAGAFASVLQGYGIGRNTVVAINIGRSYEYFLSVMAVLHCGAAFLPLDPALPVKRQKYMLMDSGARLVVYSTNTGLTDSGIIGIDLAAVDLTNHQQAEPVECDASSLAYIMYTSGSTGNPKGVCISRKALANFVGGALGLYGIQEDDRILQFANLGFDASIEEIFCAFCSGAALYLRSDEMLDPDKLLAFTIDHALTVWDLPTAFWRQLLPAEAFRQQVQLTRLKLVIIGGEATTLSDYTSWTSLGHASIQLFNTYGPTETTVVSLAYNMNQVPPQAKDIPIGRVLPGNSIAIVDRFGFQLPEGIPGELIIAGNSVSSGYVHATENQDLLFGIDDFTKRPQYKTGDLVFCDPSGFMHYAGRVDEQLKIRGFRVEPKEIELLIRQVPGVEDALVTGYAGPLGNKLLAAFYTGKSIRNDPAFIRNQLQEALPSFMVPAIILHLDKIPLTPNGKSDLVELNKLASQNQAEWKPSLRPPVGDTETGLLRIWQSIFSKKNIGVEDDFFDIGGHSLNAVQLMSEIKRKFQLDLPLSALIAKPTIRSIAGLIESKNTDHLWEVIVPIRLGGSLPPLFLIHGAGLNILLYQSLTKHLTSDRPIYGLQAKGLNGIHTITTSIGEMAAHYIEEIKKIQPRGPYYFLGFSLGGFIGFEMARILTRQNEKINFIGIIDSVASLANENRPLLEKAASRCYRTIAVPAYLLWLFIKEPWLQKRKFILNKSRNLALSLRYYYKKAGVRHKKHETPIASGDAPPAYLSNDLKIKLMEALRHYTLLPTDVQVDLFKARKATFYIPDRKFYGWSKYAEKGVIPHTMPGEHSSLFAPPNDRYFAQILEKRLLMADQPGENA